MCTLTSCILSLYSLYNIHIHVYNVYNACTCIYLIYTYSTCSTVHVHVHVHVSMHDRETTTIKATQSNTIQRHLRQLFFTQRKIRCLRWVSNQRHCSLDKCSVTELPRQLKWPGPNPQLQHKTMQGKVSREHACMCTCVRKILPFQDHTCRKPSSCVYVCIHTCTCTCTYM